MKAANANTNPATNTVRTASPSSPPMPSSPCFATTEVNPAKTIDATAYTTQRSTGGSCFSPSVTGDRRRVNRVPREP